MAPMVEPPASPECEMISEAGGEAKVLGEMTRWREGRTRDDTAPAIMTERTAMEIGWWWWRNGEDVVT
jgi:hypothetical protein